MQIIVAKDKHDTTYYDASTPELAASALLLLSRRDASGYYYTKPEGSTRLTA